MIKRLQSLWNEHVPSYVRVRCTDRFLGHMLFFAFVVVAYAVVRVLSVSFVHVVEASLLGGMFFLGTRFVLHEHGTVVTTLLAVSFVITVDVIVPLLVGSVDLSSLRWVWQRFPVLFGMSLLEVLEEDSLEEEVEGFEEAQRRD